MRVMVIFKADDRSEAGEMPTTQELAAMVSYNEELVNAGVMLAGEGLHASSAGKRIKLGAGEPQVIDGPFPNAKELVAGFWLWRVDSMEDAVEWAKRCPTQPGVELEIELRAVFETEEFGEAMTPELRAQEERLREATAAMQH